MSWLTGIGYIGNGLFRIAQRSFLEEVLRRRRQCVLIVVHRVHDGMKNLLAHLLVTVAVRTTTSDARRIRRSPFVRHLTIGYRDLHLIGLRRFVDVLLLLLHRGFTRDDGDGRRFLL